MGKESFKPTDAEIVSQVLEGSVNAFESLLIRHKDLVLKIAKKHVPYDDVEETAQEVFVRIYQSLGTYKGKSDFKHWVSSISVRTCYDYWRRAYRSREVPMSSLTEKHQKWLEQVISEESEHALEGKGAQKEARELLDWALGKLSAEDRTVLELVYLEGLSVKEAADALGWSVSNVKVRSFRSRRKLKKLLEGLIKG
jgi:RNA polymerase sigma-70 factor (ECF subfamily)